MKSIIMHELIDGNFDEQVEETRALLHGRSVLEADKVTEEHPFGPELSAALVAFLDLAERLGFSTRNIDNQVGYAEMGSGELIGILAHLDVVPEGNAKAWRHEPYAAIVEGGRLYGRGASDDKGPAVSSLYAMKALRDSGVQLGKRVRLIVGLDEESGSRCLMRYRESEEIPSYSFSPDASFPVVNAEKGIIRGEVVKRVARGNDGGESHLAELFGGDRFNVVPDKASAVIRHSDGRKICIEKRGISAHAMEPEKGENAVTKLILDVARFDLAGRDRELLAPAVALAEAGTDGRALGLNRRDDVSGDLTLNLAAAKIFYDGTEKVISLKLDIRYPVTEDGEKLIAALSSSLAENGAQLTVTTHKPPLFLPESHPVVTTLLDAYESVMGERPAPVSMGGGTYCRFMPNSVSAGPLFPGEEESAHQNDEFISLENLRRCTHIYAEALARMMSL